MQKSPAIRHPLEWTAARLQGAAVAGRTQHPMPVPVAGPIPDAAPHHHRPICAPPWPMVLR